MTTRKSKTQSPTDIALAESKAAQRKMELTAANLAPTLDKNGVNLNTTKLTPETTKELIAQVFTLMSANVLPGDDFYTSLQDFEACCYVDGVFDSDLLAKEATNWLPPTLQEERDFFIQIEALMEPFVIYLDDEEVISGAAEVTPEQDVTIDVLKNVIAVTKACGISNSSIATAMSITPQNLADKLNSDRNNSLSPEQQQRLITHIKAVAEQLAQLVVKLTGESQELPGGAAPKQIPAPAPIADMQGQILLLQQQMAQVMNQVGAVLLPQTTADLEPA